VQVRRDLGLRDLSEPGEGRHAIQILLGEAVQGLCRAWDCEVRWCRGPRIVPVADNYDRLGYRAEAITRDTRYTRYLDAGHMLRSHSTAMIPPALRRLARQPGDDVLLVCPGMVYRRDAIDWQHTGTPHQLDLWRITRQAMSSADMDQMIAMRKLSATGSAMPSAPIRAVSTKSGCFPPPCTGSCPRQRSAASGPDRGRRTFLCASSWAIWTRHSRTRPPTPSVTASTGRSIKGPNTNGPDDPSADREALIGRSTDGRLP
jgi:hypothetical protein